MRRETLFYVCAYVFLTILLTGCGTKALKSDRHSSTATPNKGDNGDPVVGQIMEIDGHGNAVTDIEPTQFAALSWELDDTLEVEFENGLKINCQYVIPREVITYTTCS